jgi:transcriptional regulator with XRE-family HTH domain
VLRSDHVALRHYRRHKGHSTRTLAEASGVSQSRISELETGPVVVKPMTAKRIADVLGLEITDIAIVSDETEVVS